MIVPSAPLEKAGRTLAYDHHWLHFDVDVLIPEKLGPCITVREVDRSIVIRSVLGNDSPLRPFDIVLAVNDMNFIDMPAEAAQCVLTAHQGKRVKLRIRRLHPSALESVELSLHKDGFFHSPRLGFTMAGGIGASLAGDNDAGLFVVGIDARGRAANDGRLRLGDRLMQVSNTHVTVNLQCIELDTALKLVKRMRNESTAMTLLVAHQN